MTLHCTAKWCAALDCSTYPDCVEVHTLELNIAVPCISVIWVVSETHTLTDIQMILLDFRKTNFTDIKILLMKLQITMDGACQNLFDYNVRLLSPLFPLRVLTAL